MRLLHLSDLHLSRYGETGTWTQRDEETGSWETLHSWQRWQIEGQRDKKDRPEKMRLVDPSGVVHKVRNWPKKDDKTVSALLALAMERHLTSAEALIRKRPSADDLRALLRVDRDNTNLLFVRLLDNVLVLEPELIVLTGDITDNGFGYALVEHYLGPWIERGRLFVVPGNHDTYDMFPRKGRRKRLSAKEDRYRAFARVVGMDVQDCGAWFQRVGDLAIVGLSSCKPPITMLSASGEVSNAQLKWLSKLGETKEFREARLRLCLLHHHLLRMPFELGKRGPIEVGIRLRNAADVMQVCTEVGIDLLFNGHRHHGYMIQLPGRPTVVSSPSSTLGCKSTDMEYVWTVDLADERPYPKTVALDAHPSPDHPRGRNRR